jgi:hypothetical protein
VINIVFKIGVVELPIEQFLERFTHLTEDHRHERRGCTTGSWTHQRHDINQDVLGGRVSAKGEIGEIGGRCVRLKLQNLILVVRKTTRIGLRALLVILEGSWLF